MTIRTTAHTPGPSLDYTFRAGASAESPLMLMFHGRGGNRDSMWPFSKVVPREWAICCPEGPLDELELGGKIWWRLGEEARFEERIGSARAVLEFIEPLARKERIIPRFVAALGFSQGAGLTLLAAAQPDMPFRGIGVLSGFLPKDEAGKIPVLPKSLRIFVAHGTVDRILPVESIRDWTEDLRRMGYEVCFAEEAVGHRIGAKTMGLLREWVRSLDDEQG